MPNDMTLRNTAQELDAKDTLAKYRDEFLIADSSLCYLDGNSLGRMPTETVNVVDQYLRTEWATKLVSGWANWIDEAQLVGDLISRASRCRCRPDVMR